MTDPAPIVERRGELAALVRSLDRAARGRGSGIVIEGPPGIGKTRLVEAAIAEARGRDLRVADALGDPHGSASPFSVACQLFDPFLRGEAARSYLTGPAAAAAGVFGAPPHPDAPPADPARVIRGLFWLAAALAEDAPLCLVVDDLQWADAQSARFVHYLTRRGTDLPIAVVLAARPPQPDTPAEVREAMGRCQQRLHLEPLTSSGVHALVQTYTRADADGAFIRACMESAGGNPFLTLELLRHLARRGLAPTADAAAALPHSTPDGVRVRVDLRLEATGADARALAQALSVTGTGDVGLCAEIARLDPPAAEKAADALAREYLIHDRRPLAFVHPIVANAVAATLTARDRSILHRRAAGAYARRMAGSERSASHLLEVDPAGDAWAVDTLRAAAYEASRRGAPDAAAAYLRRALDEGAPVKTDELALNLGIAFVAAGDFDSAEGLLSDLTLQTADRDTRDRAAVVLVGALGVAGRYDEGKAIFTERRIHRLSAPIAVLTRAFVALCGVLSIPDHRTGARQIADLHETAPIDLLPPPIRCAVLATRVMSGSAEHAAAAREELLALDPQDPVRASLGGAFLLIGDPATVEEVLEPSRRACLAANDVGNLGPAATMSANAAIMAGRISEAVALARMAVDAAEDCRVPYGRDYAAAAYATALVEAGQSDDAAAALAAVTGDTRDGRQVGVWVEIARAAVHAASGRHTAALESLTWVGDELRRANVRNPEYAPWHAPAVEAALALGDRALAREIATEALADAEAQGITAILGVAHRLMGEVLDDEEGAAHLEEAVRQMENSPRGLEHMRALAARGRHRARHGRREDGLSDLRAALDRAHHAGASALADRLHRQIVELGGRPRRRALRGAEALTPAERQVAVLAAQGNSNQQISQTLFLTVGTVERHLSRVYRKLDIGGRGQLANAISAGTSSDDSGPSSRS